MRGELSLIGDPIRARLGARADIVMSKGLFALINESLSPRDAMIADLLAIAAALEAADIAHWLIRRDADQATLAVAAVDGKRVAAALASAFASEPFYARGRSKGPLLVADGELSRAKKPGVVKLYRPRVSANGRGRMATSSAVRIEFWTISADQIVMPSENVLMRRTVPRAEAVEVWVPQYGRQWRSWEGMFASLASDITFDIDIVFSWVDGTSTEFQRARALRMRTYIVGAGDDSDARYRQIDELKYALRSINMFAPWVRRIFIVTDSDAPTWLAEHPRVTVVRSAEFFTDPGVLPTHNSHAVESQLHRIEGLSEHFLYSNDDMFFGRAVGPELFFSPGGISKFIEANTRIGLGAAEPWRSGFENAARVNRRLLVGRFGRVTVRHLEHAAVPLRRSVLAELEAEFPEDFARTAASRFRSATDISVTNSLYHYYALLTGRAVVHREARVKYVETTLAKSLRQLDRILERRRYEFLCLNDGSEPEISVEERTSAVTAFLERYFPVPAPWEVRPAEGLASSSAVLVKPAR